VTDWNAKIIGEFRATSGRVGERYHGRPILLLHHIGARTGTVRVNPLVYMPEEDRLVVVASAGGRPRNPGWLHNLRAHPDATAEIGTETVRVKAAEITGDDYERTWPRMVEWLPVFAEYQGRTTRRIPLVALHRME
jgi:deazaflavin-dependent oxidoreductase (nitroreductase family)